jgi:hypothetical protein
MKMESAPHPEYVAPDGARKAYGPAFYKYIAPDGAWKGSESGFYKDPAPAGAAIGVRITCW